MMVSLGNHCDVTPTGPTISSRLMDLMVHAWLKPEEVGKLFFFDTLMVDPISKESGLLRSNVSILLCLMMSVFVT